MGVCLIPSHFIVLNHAWDVNAEGDFNYSSNEIKGASIRGKCSGENKKDFSFVLNSIKCSHGGTRDG